MLSTPPSPIVSRTPTAWLAVSPAGVHPRIGVQRATEDEAREAFRESWARWLSYSDFPSDMAAQ